MTRAGHDSGGASSSHAPPPPPPPHQMSIMHRGFRLFDPSRIGSEYATPPSYQAPSSYHSQSFHGHSAPLPSGTQLQERPADPPESAEAPQAPQPRRTTRAVRPPPCGTGGHRHPPGGDH
ncbi:hypothetical protein PIB30_071799 [Stylosanthes scabra]|uniref:Uncharacterized protein n=1 Tax=Stylosanthes scabra TaxID=79078 RepID=A0ABU6YM25_9FABA|nr:hypothetical protein [Stylosanthes scabra]